LDFLSIKKAEKLQNESQFDPGSMGPKVDAILKFLKNGGRRGIITDSKNITGTLTGVGGTQFYDP
tara:strand:+ start:385 stop:579 length:195 start_codon:yes stop_codon:yes gene_type:complete